VTVVMCDVMNAKFGRGRACTPSDVCGRLEGLKRTRRSCGESRCLPLALSTSRQLAFDVIVGVPVPGVDNVIDDGVITFAKMFVAAV